mmetsp:Transcript_27837/g.58806  ORF Transcript_27837/g.58806 Transcript_27837/m.58806 type:complete len:332 (+) Transcript_27837:508-1503(+)
MNYLSEEITNEEMPDGKDPRRETNAYSIGCRPMKRSCYGPQFPNEIVTQPNKMKPLQMNPLQANFITDTMKELKERAAKRQKTIGGYVGHRFTNDSRVSFCDHDTDDMSGNEEKSSKFDIMDELNAYPNAIQILATPGGLITHWNQAFSMITKPSTSLKKIPLTIFELVDSKCLSSLYSMLALSLHNIGIVEVETFTLDDEKDGRGAVGSAMTLPTWKELHKKCARSSPISHLSITLPCKLFQNCLTRYNITIVFMNDISSANTCFLGILTPRSKGDYHDDSSFTSCESSTCPDNSKDKDILAAPREHSLPHGQIIRVDDGMLCQVLLGHK